MEESRIYSLQGLLGPVTPAPTCWTFGWLVLSAPAAGSEDGGVLGDILAQYSVARTQRGEVLRPADGAESVKLPASALPAAAEKRAF